MNALDDVLRAFTSGALTEASACFAHDGVYREVGKAPICGRAAIDAHFARFGASGRSWRFVVEIVVRGEGHACVVYRFATGGEGLQWHERDGCAIVRFGTGNLIAEWREYHG
jgi:hypothetical protein